MKAEIRIIPTLAYKDAKKAIKWLVDAFEFEKNMVHESEDGKVMHAQLTYKGNMIMLGSSNSGTPFSKLIKHPDEIDGYETQSNYIIIDDDEIDAHFERAKKHGAKIVMELVAEDYGGKNYVCYDIEGHLWSFGSYNPWKAQ